MTSSGSEIEALTVLDSMHQHVALLDPSGEIMAVNRAWMNFGLANDATPASAKSIGVNYLAVCGEAAALPPTPSSAAARAGIAGVLAGSLPSFELEYPCARPGELRWFLMRVSPLVGERPGAGVLAAAFQPAAPGLGMSAAEPDRAVLAADQLERLLQQIKRHDSAALTRFRVLQTALCRSFGKQAAMGAITRKPQPGILLVDDDVVTIQALSKALEGIGRTHFAKSGHEALRLAHTEDIDLIDLRVQPW